MQYALGIVLAATAVAAGMPIAPLDLWIEIGDDIGKCGLLGIEPLLLLGIFALRRRIREISR